MRVLCNWHATCRLPFVLSHVVKHDTRPAANAHHCLTYRKLGGHSSPHTMSQHYIQSFVRFHIQISISSKFSLSHTVFPNYANELVQSCHSWLRQKLDGIVGGHRNLHQHRTGFALPHAEGNSRVGSPRQLRKTFGVQYKGKVSETKFPKLASLSTGLARQPQ